MKTEEGQAVEMCADLISQTSVAKPLNTQFDHTPRAPP